MPTLLSHAVVAAAVAQTAGTAQQRVKLVYVGIFCALLPDADVIGYVFLGIPYGHFIGHRGFMHSIFFAGLTGLMAAGICFQEHRFWFGSWGRRAGVLTIIAASHGILDAMTNGGRGIALLAPFNNHRIFLPWTPIEVSPLGLGGFLSHRGLVVLKNELLWIWLPCLTFMAALTIIRTIKRRRTGA